MTTPTPLSPTVNVLHQLGSLEYTLANMIYGDPYVGAAFFAGGFALLLLLSFVWVRATYRDTRPHFLFGLAGLLAAFGAAYAIDGNPFRLFALFGWDDTSFSHGFEMMGVATVTGFAKTLVLGALGGSLPILAWFLANGIEPPSDQQMSDGLALLIMASALSFYAAIIWFSVTKRRVRAVVFGFLFGTALIYTGFPLISFLFIGGMKVFLIGLVILAMAGGGAAATRRRY